MYNLYHSVCVSEVEYPPKIGVLIGLTLLKINVYPQA